MLHFTYSEKKTSTELRQGDILRRTPEIEGVLRQAHPHYLSKAENKYFIVLTQDCELTRRDRRTCAARYIELAAVRPVRVAILRQMEKFRDSSVDYPICTTQGKARIQQFMARLLNNNDPEYFYLHREQQCDFPEDCCALLALSIAIKADLHYDICLQAKMLELTDSFRAKLGWLVGRMYSPVGTQDWPEKVLQEEVRNKIEELAVWIDEKQKKQLRRLIVDWKRENPARPLDALVIKELVDKIPRRKEQIITSTLRVLRDSDLLPEDSEIRVANLLRSDAVLSNLLKGL